jgi:hypothetical protein
VTGLELLLVGLHLGSVEAHVNQWPNLNTLADCKEEK